MRETKTFDKELWSKGTRAEMDLPNDMPFIKNMHEYGGGALGPRSGWQALFSISSLTVDHRRVFAAPFYYSGTPMECVVTCSTNGVQLWQTSADADPVGTKYAEHTTSNATFSVHRISDTQWLIGSVLYDFRLDTLAAKPYAIVRTDVSATVNTEFGYTSTVLDGGVGFAGRAFYWGTALTSGTDTYGERRRLYYSDPYAFTSFTEGAATQYIQIDRPVQGAFVLNGAMYIWDSGDYWWKFELNNSGDPQDGYLRQIGQGFTPREDHGVAIVDQVAFFYADNGMLCAFDENGLDDQTLSHLAPLRQVVQPDLGVGEDSKANIIYMPWHDITDTTVGTGTQMLGKAYIFQGGRWWFEERTTTNTDFRDRFGILNNYTNVVGRDSLIMRAIRSFDNTNYRTEIHVRNLDLDSPAKETDTYSNDVDEEYVFNVVNDRTTHLGELRLPRLHGESNQFVRIAKVSVDCQYWKTAGTWPTAAMTCTVVDAAGTTHTGVGDLVAANLANTSTTTNAPGYVRIIYTFDSDPFTHFAEVRLTGIASLAIEQVHVDFEVETREW
jgi:hypothetical protein